MNQRYPFVNIPLPYAFNALEPYIDEKTMYLHHDRHLQTYINNLNAILKANPSLQKYTLEELVTNWNQLPQQVQIPVRNNAGGVYNHRFYFDGLTPQTLPIPQNRLYREIEEQFQSFEAFQNIFKQTALSVFGSGYAWLLSAKNLLRIVTTANQDVPDIRRWKPIFCIDVWEHAYYLKHYNVRADYIDDWFSIVNWKKAEERFSR